MNTGTIFLSRDVISREYALLLSEPDIHFSSPSLIGFRFDKDSKYQDRLAFWLRKLPIVILATLLIALGHPCIAQEAEVKELAKDLTISLAKAPKRSAAVVDFTNLDGKVTPLGRFFAEELETAIVLYNPSALDLVDRTRIQLLIQENKLASKEGLIDPATARKLGKIAGVQMLITGTITPLDNRVRLSVKALDSENARILAVASRDLPMTPAITQLMNQGLIGPSGGDVYLVPGEDPTSTKLGDVIFSFQGCKNGPTSTAADQIVCWGSVANRDSKREDLIIGKETIIVDNLGQQAYINFESFGGEPGHPCCETHSLEPGLPLRFWFDVRGYRDRGNLVNIILVANGHKAILHDLRLDEQ